MVSIPLGRPGGLCHQDLPAAWQLKFHRSHNGSPLAPGPPPTRTSRRESPPHRLFGVEQGRQGGTSPSHHVMPQAPGRRPTPPTRPTSSLFPFHTQALSADSGTKASSFTSIFPPRLATAPQGRYRAPGCQSSETKPAVSTWGGGGETGPELLGLPTYLSQTHTQGVASHLTEMKSS